MYVCSCMCARVCVWGFTSHGSIQFNCREGFKYLSATLLAFFPIISFFFARHTHQILTILILFLISFLIRRNCWLSGLRCCNTTQRRWLQSTSKNYIRYSLKCLFISTMVSRDDCCFRTETDKAIKQ